eukprot:6199262-Pleurochrysis_carterae.AAC.3
MSLACSRFVSPIKLSFAHLVHIGCIRRNVMCKAKHSHIAMYVHTAAAMRGQKGLAFKIHGW